jgi:hypothetical protein
MSPVCQFQLKMTLPRGFSGVFGVTVRLMSDGELRRLEVLQDLDRRRLAPAAAGQLLGLERRQLFFLLRGVEQDRAASLVSKHRGKLGSQPTEAFGLCRPQKGVLSRWRSPAFAGGCVTQRLRCGLHEIATMAGLSNMLAGRAAASGLPRAPGRALVRTVAEARP